MKRFLKRILVAFLVPSARGRLAHEWTPRYRDDATSHWTLVLRNDADAALDVFAVEPTCDCVRLRPVAQRSLPPRSSLRIAVTVDEGHRTPGAGVAVRSSAAGDPVAVLPLPPGTEASDERL